MGRCRKQRCCRYLDSIPIFRPVGIPLFAVETTQIDADEFEALRLCDLEGKNQIEAAAAMGISRGTVQRLLKNGRKKITDALLHRRSILISDGTKNGGNYDNLYSCDE